MITILSPAKKLDFNKAVQSKLNTQPDFLDDSKILINELRKLKPKDLSKLMKISDDLANLNVERNLSWSTPFNMYNARQAIFAFRGQAYIGLDADSLDDNDLKFAQDHLIILSGLYGVLKPLDLMQAYRLEMGTSLKNPRGKNLYEFWGDKITDAINKELAKQKHKVLVNLRQMNILNR